MSNFDAKNLYEKLKQSSDFEEIDYYIYEKFPPFKFFILGFLSRYKGAVGQIYFNDDGLIIFRSGTRLRRFLPKKITKGIYIPTKEIRNATIENKSLTFYLDEKGIKKYEEFRKSYGLIFSKSLNKDVEKLDSIIFLVKDISKAKDIVKLIRFNVKSQQKIKTESLVKSKVKLPQKITAESLVKSKVKLPQKIKTESKSDPFNDWLNKKKKENNITINEKQKKILKYLFHQDLGVKKSYLESKLGFTPSEVRWNIKELLKKKYLIFKNGIFYGIKS